MSLAYSYVLSGFFCHTLHTGAQFFRHVLLILVQSIKSKREKFLFSPQRFSRDNYVFHQRTREDGESPYSHGDQC